MSADSARLWALRTALRSVGTVAPGVAARWAETLFCTPPRHRSRDEDDAFLATGRRFDVESEGQRVATWEWGSGPAVLLTHGWGSRAARLGALASALVGAGFRVVAFDAPAHGASTGRSASLPEFARALHAVAGAAGPLYGLLGHSLGGAATALALQDGLAARRAVLLAAPANIVRFSEAFADHLRVPTRVHETMRRNIQTRLRIRFEDLQIPNIARALRLPVLIVHDRDDPEVPYDDGEELARAWPGARLVTTTGLGHRAILRDPMVVRRTIAFLQEGLDE